MVPPHKLPRDIVEQRAQRLLDEAGFGRKPIDVTKVAEFAGYKVVFRYFEEADLSGTVIQDGSGRVTLGINTLHPPVRQRFSIAHEIGHAQLHLEASGEAVFVDPPAGVFFRDSRASLGDDPREINANQYAAALLMPKRLVHEALSKLARSAVRFTIDGAVNRLADQFDVSPQAMRYRLVVLGLIEPN